MAVGDSLQSFDSFLDSVTQMQDAVTQFDLGQIPTNELKTPLDGDIVKSLELDKLTLSEDSEESESSFEYESDEAQSSSEGSLEWLRTTLSSISDSTAMSIDDLYSTVLGTLTSDSSDNELQSILPEILGYEHLETVIELISQRKSIQQNVC